MAPPSNKCPRPCGSEDGWIEYRRYVIDKLKAHTESLATIAAIQQKIREDLRALKTKMAIGCGFVALVVSILVERFTR